MKKVGLWSIGLVLLAGASAEARPLFKRIEMAKTALRPVNPARKLSFGQKVAIYRAHFVGLGQLGADKRTRARVGNYTPQQLLRKAQILKRAGFDKAERKALIKGKVVGFWDAFAQGLSDGARAADSFHATRRLLNGQGRPGDFMRAAGMNSTAADADAMRSALRGDTRGAANNLLKSSLFGSDW
jgi:hypothetical protein